MRVPLPVLFPMDLISPRYVNSMYVRSYISTLYQDFIKIDYIINYFLFIFKNLF